VSEEQHVKNEDEMMNLTNQTTISLEFEVIYHTHTRLTALFRDYPGEPVPER